MFKAMTGKTGLILYPIIWIVITVAFIILAPNLNQLVSEEGQIEIPDEYPTQQFNKMVNADGGFPARKSLLLTMMKTDYHRIMCIISNKQ